MEPPPAAQGTSRPWLPPPLPTSPKKGGQPFTDKQPKMEAFAVAAQEASCQGEQEDKGAQSQTRPVVQVTFSHDGDDDDARQAPADPQRNQEALRQGVQEGLRMGEPEEPVAESATTGTAPSTACASAEACRRGPRR